MKRLITLILSFLIFILGTNITYGQSVEKMSKSYVDSYVSNKKSLIDASKVTKTARGRLLSSASIQISDEGSGLLGVYADTLCHAPMNEIYMTIYLDIWNEQSEDWDMVDYYEYKFSVTDNPDEDLTMAVVSFDLAGLNRGREYRLRGLHMAKDFDSNTEIMSTETDWIPLN